MEEPSNDTFFWPVAVSKTIDAIPGQKNIDVIPNLNHKLTSIAGTQRQIFLDYYLKDTASTLLRIIIKIPLNRRMEAYKSTLRPFVRMGVRKVELFFSGSGPNWQDRVGESITATEISPGIYRVFLQVETPAKLPKVGNLNAGNSKHMVRANLYYNKFMMTKKISYPLLSVLIDFFYVSAKLPYAPVECDAEAKTTKSGSKNNRNRNEFRDSLKKWEVQFPVLNSLLI